MANYVPKIKDEDIKSLNEENYEDMEIGQVLPFNHIAKKSEGKQALAVLKADVDRLGMLFSNGLISTNYTISRIATLSRMFDGFFSSYLNVLLKDKYPYIYTEYAGGDDLLLIGPWNRIMNLAIDMRQTFKQYTCNNPDVNISAGISLMHVGEPVTNALREAEKLLDTSKEKGRDKISLFGVTLDWDTYSKAIEQGKWLSKNVAKDKKSEFNPGFIYRLLQYYLMKYRVEQLKDTSDQKIPIKDAKWHSQLNYDMSRNIKSMDVRQEIEKMFSGEEIDNVKIATTYCLYSIRN